ncbi:Trp biosynthesis-associated membrane protein [Actinomadura sp. ATCC 31491]|uniref:Trp biosynthesis-associated membrane protein n=1 Tax=Actinomadura luzonensis TaxID=2805427 RepID=A0ABT0G8J7_9ACTN|nr:Trp biosynthesis-associated membrane protein [Actinomadura luzonensis]MCK2220901.1 Trp biosynthesis-associated membrane protein [Actinomadura luzonensis]
MQTPDPGPAPGPASDPAPGPTSVPAPGPASGPAPRRAAGARRELAGWLALTVAGCLLVLLAAGRAWVSVAEAGAEAPTGGDLSPVLTPVALAGLAGVVAVLATKGAGRRVVGALLALCGLGAGVATWTALDGSGVTDWLAAHNTLRGATGLSWHFVALWPAVSGAGALLLAAGGALAIARGGRWAGMSARYERRGPAPAAEGDKALWDALDRGDDPTDPR